MCYPGNTANRQPHWALTYNTSRSQQQVRTKSQLPATAGAGSCDLWHPSMTSLTARLLRQFPRITNNEQQYREWSILCNGSQYGITDLHCTIRTITTSCMQNAHHKKNMAIFVYPVLKRLPKHTCMSLCLWKRILISNQKKKKKYCTYLFVGLYFHTSMLTPCP
jgi:hypothetical protein